MEITKETQDKSNSGYSPRLDLGGAEFAGSGVYTAFLLNGTNCAVDFWKSSAPFCHKFALNEKNFVTKRSKPDLNLP